MRITTAFLISIALQSCMLIGDNSESKPQLPPVETVTDGKNAFSFPKAEGVKSSCGVPASENVDGF